DARLQGLQMRVVTDVTNSLFGAEGAAQVYGEQKGADEPTIQRLDTVLERLALVSGNVALAQRAGSGAAGGFAFGLAAFCNARISSGFDAVSDALGLYF